MVGYLSWRCSRLASSYGQEAGGLQDCAAARHHWCGRVGRLTAYDSSMTPRPVRPVVGSIGAGSSSVM
jgi:hypothetical protein